MSQNGRTDTPHGHRTHELKVSEAGQQPGSHPGRRRRRRREEQEYEQEEEKKGDRRRKP